MPDLITRQHCATANPWQVIVVPSQTEKDKSYRVLVPFPEDPQDELSCECKGFIHRGKCIHQEIAFAKLCRWTEVKGPETQTPDEESMMICPRCKGQTVRTTEWQ